VLAAYDAGDHLHPNDAGYVAMANSIDLDKLLGNH
jgi:lysophospholipase L1-like esterase